ncbi:MAG: septal ring lytic transglycosylase RlpA family protein [Pseudomonadota bacterium]
MLRRPAQLATLFLVCTLVACGGVRPKDGPPSGSSRIPDLPGDAIPRPEPRSRYGNGPVYEVFGKRYTVMPSSAGYHERGVASWYGKKFHGNLTSNREVYDMYAMTAAHKTLPLPTYVRVRNLRNDKTIIVRVNDRGPFVHNRIIDLSYAAALKLDMVRDGTSLVEVTAISFDKPPGDRPVRRSTPPTPPPEDVTAEPVPVPAPAVATTANTEHLIYVQVGAFGERSNAERRVRLLTSSGIENAFIYEDTSAATRLYRVRIGPVASVIKYDILVEELENLGITDPYLISE